MKQTSTVLILVMSRKKTMVVQFTLSNELYSKNIIGEGVLVKSHGRTTITPEVTLQEMDEVFRMVGRGYFSILSDRRTKCISTRFL